MMTVAALIAAGAAPGQARVYVEPLAAACARFHIDTPRRVAAFVSQCLHESAGLTRVEESLYYTTPERIRLIWPARVPSLVVAASLARNPQALANRVYAGRNGNGDEASGDGWRYRGRGLIQLTGRANYLAAQADIGAAYVAQPDLVQTPAHAALTAAWFFAEAGCNAMADAGQVEAITRAINGPALAGLAERRRLFAAVLEAFA